MKKILFLLSMITAPVFAQDRAACNFTDSESTVNESGERCGHTVPSGSYQQELYQEALRIAKNDPGLAGSIMTIRVDNQWELVDRRAQPKPTDPTILSKALTVIQNVTGKNVSGSVTVTYVYVRGYTEQGLPLYESVVFNAGGAMTQADQDAAKSMADAIGKNHK